MNIIYCLLLCATTHLGLSDYPEIPIEGEGRHVAFKDRPDFTVSGTVVAHPKDRHICVKSHGFYYGIASNEIPHNMYLMIGKHITLTGKLFRHKDFHTTYPSLLVDKEQLLKEQLKAVTNDVTN